MDTTSYLFSTRLHGWMSRHGNYTSDVKEARVFPLAEALAMCHRHKDGTGVTLIPVRVRDMEQL
jgi:hypothetical protein